MDIIESVSGPISNRDIQDKITALENEWYKLPQLEVPVIHRYAGGICIREFTIPKHTFLTGRIYKHDHIDTMISGDITVSTDNGMKRLSGYNSFASMKGKKRAAYAHEQTIWTTVHNCPQMEDDEYIDYLTVQTFEALDNYDYKQTLLEYGLTEEVARVISENEEDMILDSYDGVELRPSKIEGRGLFATQLFKSGDFIAPLILGGESTKIPKYLNHSYSPNAVIIRDGDETMLMALCDIDNREIVINYRASLALQIRKVA